MSWGIITIAILVKNEQSLKLLDVARTPIVFKIFFQLLLT